jgi:prolyl oligopeptidase
MESNNTPPVAPVHEVSDTYFGITVVDPYRWMEDSTNPQFEQWLKEQNNYARTVLDNIPGRAELLSRIASLNDAGEIVRSLQLAGECLFYLKQAHGDNVSKLYVRTSLDDEERLLVDPEKLSRPEVNYAIDYFKPSPDGRYVTYGISLNGSEDSVLHIMECNTGRELEEKIDRTWFSAGTIFWNPNSESFFYNRQQKLTDGISPSERGLKSRTYLHKLGTNPELDQAVLGFGLSDQVQINESDVPFIVTFSSTPYILGVIAHGVQNEVTIYSAPISSLSEADIPWQKIVDVSDAVIGFPEYGGPGISGIGNKLYLLTHRDAPRLKIVCVNLENPDIGNAETIVSPSELVLKGLGIAEDGLYVQQLDGGISRILHIPFDNKLPQSIALPFEGSIQELVINPNKPGFLVRLASWTKSSLWLIYNPKTEQFTNTQLKAPSTIDFSEIEAMEVKAESTDGTLVPLSIISKRDLVRDGSHPTLLYGYGAYGISIEPFFNPTFLAWLERGGILAVAHVRGGGEYGEDWHKAGMKLLKENSINDFLACAEYLIDQKYTAPAHLSGEGGSAGGILIGGAITRRPEIFGTAVISVGISNSLRFEITPNGPANIPEFGSVETKEGFQSLYAMDAYHHVQDCTMYPAVLLTTGINDPRVEPWQSGKMAARLQAATASNKPILLRVDYEGGHGSGATKSQKVIELADEYAFLFWQLGHPDFQLQVYSKE